MGIQNDMPILEYRVFMINDGQQSDITFVDNEMYYCGVRALGVALVRVTPPTDLIWPYLYCSIAGMNLGEKRSCSMMLFIRK